MGTGLSSAGVFAKWGASAAVVAACAVFGLVMPAAAQPSIPPPPPGGPTFEFPVQPGPTGLEPTRPDESEQAPPGPRPAPLLPQSINLAMKLESDGGLRITEQVFVQADHTMTRRAPLRIQAGDGRDRVFTIRDVTVKGDGTAEVTDDEFVLRIGGGVTTVTYTVDGAVVDAGDHQEVRWQLASGWDVKLRMLRASFIAPNQPDSIVCLAGARNTDSPCQSALTDTGQVLRVVQQDLPAGERIDLSLHLPAGTVGANAEFDGTAEPGPFSLTTASAVGLGVLAVVLLGGFVLLWLARGRDAKALATEVGPVDLLLTDHGRVAFASPDGVLPGEVGTVVDERVDLADVTATVVDLAVRNYLAIQQTSDGDWRISRRNAPDESLTGYERAVYTGLLGGGDTVTLSELRGRGVDLVDIRDELYAHVVSRDWFTRRPDHERSLWSMTGVLLAVLGGAVTVVLALTVGHALLGLALVVGGLGLALGARLMPARTRRGTVLVQQIRGLRGYLRGTDATTIPEADREMVLSRSLPYAVVLGETEGWLTRFGGLDAAADGTPGLYWYEGEPTTFAADFPGFLRAVDEALGRERMAPA